MTGKLGNAKKPRFSFSEPPIHTTNSFWSVSTSAPKSSVRLPETVEDLQSRLLPVAAKGKTALLDAIYLGLVRCGARGMANAHCSSYSDGVTIIAGTTEKDIKRLVREADTQLYSIGIFERSSIAAEHRRNSTAITCSAS